MNIEIIKAFLGGAAANYSDAVLSAAYLVAAAEVKAYCNRELDEALEMVVAQIAAIKVTKAGSAGLASQSYSGVSESYIDGYPAEIQAILNKKRKIKII